MDTERALLISKLMMVVGFGSAILILIGELLGWWNEFGEVGLPIATLVGALGGTAALVVGSSSEEVRSVHAAVRSNGETLDSVDGKLDSVDGRLESMDGKLGKLETLETVDSRLDAVQVELDRQTGVMGEQVEILGEIRDRI